MARKRMIDPSIWTDEGMAELTPRQQLLYIALFSNADDDGRLKASPTALRLMLPTIYPGTDTTDLEADLDAVLRVMSQLVRYCVDGRPYLSFKNYRTWQQINKPTDSKLPPPPGETPDDMTALPEPDNTTTGVLPEPDNTTTTQKKRIERNRTEPLAADDPPQVEASKRPRKPDAYFDQFISVFGFDLDLLNDVERGRINKACKLVRESKGRPEEIPIAVDRYQTRHPTWELTPLAIASNWNGLMRSNGHRGKSVEDEYPLARANGDGA